MRHTGNAKLAGLVDQLHLVGNQYNIALTMYFIPYCLAECPANLVLKKLRPSRWLPGITILWGTVMTVMGLVNSYPQLIGVRICLGIAEAGLFPGAVYYLTFWYPRNMMQLRVGIIESAATTAGAFSGLLAFAIEFMDGTQGLEAWSWIFILEGIATVVVGLMAFFIIVDSPSIATFLTPEERAYIIHRKKYDNSGNGEAEEFRWRYVWDAITDWQVWLHILVYMSIVGPLYGISLFLPFGFSVPVSQLLSVPPYVFATIVLFAFAHFSDKMQKRSPFIILGLSMLLVGFNINISPASRAAKYFGTFFCVAGSYAAFPGVVAWLGNNLAGQYKRGVGLALHIGIEGVLRFLKASNIYRTRDAPRYILGHGIALMFVGIGLVAAPSLIFLYTRINAKRKREIEAGLDRKQLLCKEMIWIRLPEILGLVGESGRVRGTSPNHQPHDLVILFQPRMAQVRKSEIDSASLEKGSIVISQDVTDDKKKKIGAQFDFGGDSTLPPPPELSPEEVKRLYRKIDLRILPILSLMYLCSFLDRGNIGNAKLAGLVEELELDGNKYNIALTMFFIPYCLFECPANLVLKKFRPSRWLPGITIAWGTVMTLMGLVKTYPQLVGTRVCLGVAEAGLFPGVVYYLTFWYPRYMQQYRIGLFFGAATIAGAFSGLLAFAIEHMDGTQGFRAWSWIFILEGIATVAVGIVAIFVLVDFPVTASFLTPEERAYVIHRKKYDNSRGFGEAEEFASRYVWAAFKDWQIWLHILVYMSIVGPLYSISLFLPFGYSVPITQLLTVPPYIFACIVLLVFAHFSDKVQKRSPFILLGLTLLVVGFSINVSPAPRGVKYFGTFLCVAGSYAPFPGVVAWLGNNLSGQYKRGVGMALQIGIGNFSGAIASNIYRTRDAPRYILGHGLVLMFIGIGFVCTPLAIATYLRINSRRRENIELAGGKVDLSVEEMHELGDRAPDFKYTL
ncbi:hypothetical protein ACEPAF_2961 [Sanghuangporus sanghuang]